VELAIVLLVMALLVALPEWHARDELTKACDSVQIGTRLDDVDRDLLFAGDEGNSFTCGFDEASKTGAIVKLFRGWFPFGRDFCVVTVQNNVVTGKHILFGTIDYDCDSCNGDIRPIVDIGSQCS